MNTDRFLICCAITLQTFTTGCISSSRGMSEIYSKCIEQLNLSKEECIGVEDTANGVLSIYRAGMKPIMIPDLEEPSKEIENLVYAKLESLSDVIPLLKEMN